MAVLNNCAGVRLDHLAALWFFYEYLQKLGSNECTSIEIGTDKKHYRYAK